MITENSKENKPQQKKTKLLHKKKCKDLVPFPLNIQYYITNKHEVNVFNWINLYETPKLPDSTSILVTNKSDIENIKQWLACI